MLIANTTFAQLDEQRDSFALRVYYSDLYLALSELELDDVPFQQKEAKVQPDDSLLKFAERNGIDGLDSFHLVAAIYEANPQIFNNGESVPLSVGSTLKMPTVGDIFYAQERFENLKAAGSDVIIASAEEPVRKSAGQVLAVNLSTHNALPDNEDGTLSVSSRDTELPGSDKAASDLIVQATPVAPETSPTSAVGAQSGSVKIATEQVNAGALLVAQMDQTAKPEVDGESALEKEKKIWQQHALASAKHKGDQKRAKEDPELEIAAAIPAAEPAMKPAASVAKVAREAANTYLGPVRNPGAASLPSPADPLSSIIEWEYDADITVGTVLNQLAEYVGYELVSTDKSVLKTYSRRLPGMQRRMKRISVEDGFALLAGRGLETVYDHVARSIKHEPRKTPYPKKQRRGKQRRKKQGREKKLQKKNRWQKRRRRVQRRKRQRPTKRRRRKEHRRKVHRRQK